MNYSLGNMLGGAGALNADKLSLNLQFAADKTLTARKGPTPVFTRASGATQVGATGLIEYAPENLVLQSQNFSNATWQKLNGATVGATVADPFGGTSAYTLNFSSTNYSRFEQWSPGSQTGDVITVSVYLRADSNTTIFTRLGIETFATFNVTTNWQRFEYTATQQAIGLYPQLNNYESGAKTIYAYGFQVERFSSARTYIPTTTASVYGARFDHDPTTGESLGLLVEEQRTNLLSGNSQNPGPGSAGWGGGGTTTLDSAITAPDGTTGGVYYISASERVCNFAGSGLNAVCVSFFVKQRSGQSAAYRIEVFQSTDTVISLGQQEFHFTGAIDGGSTNARFSNLSRTAYSNGWFRFSAVVTTASGTFNNTARLDLEGSAYSNYIWGAQVEAGSFPTSYIPTTTASVVRSADICSISGSDFTSFYNQSEGTLLSQTQKITVGSNTFIVAMSDGTFNNSLDLRYNNITLAGALMNISNVSQFTGFSATVTSGALVKQSVAYKLNDCAYSANGASAITDTSASIPTFSQLNIGNTYSNNLAINGHIASIRYYKKRLSNAKLQSLTA
jgi:hypothetical protein